MLRRAFQSLLITARKTKLKMTEVSEKIPDQIIEPTEQGKSIKDDVSDDISSQKRPLEVDPGGPEEVDQSKKPKIAENTTSLDETEKAKPIKKKKMVMFLVYCGKDYQGMQLNPDAKTIELDLMAALLKAGVVNEEQAANPGRKMFFQRAARTDKGVSAAGQICSLNMFVDIDNPMEKINSHLGEHIKVVGLQRATKKFDSKNAASARTYSYLLPTFAFTPCEKFVIETFNITDEICQKVNDTLKLFVGTHNFHNFTSGKKPDDPSARRYIIDFQMGKPFEQEGLELAVITVKGQSFMLHQIRKMIGLTIAIVRGLTGIEAIERAYGNDKCDVPRAPGLGLVLDRVHYDAYNKRYGGDGLHEAIIWEKYQDQVDKFKRDYIYKTILDTEKEERSMIQWLATLHLHHFDVIKDLTKPLPKTALQMAKDTLYMHNKEQEKQKSPSASASPSSSMDNEASPSELSKPEEPSKSTVLENEAVTEPISVPLQTPVIENKDNEQISCSENPKDVQPS